METIFTEQVQRVKAAAKSVLLSSHILSEVEKLRDTVTIIRNGRTVESGTMSLDGRPSSAALVALLCPEPVGQLQALARFAILEHLRLPYLGRSHCGI